MWYLAFLGGVVLGSVLTSVIIRYYKTAHGYFSFHPDKDDPEIYSITVRIPQNQPGLLNKKKIILDKEKPHE